MVELPAVTFSEVLKCVVILSTGAGHTDDQNAVPVRS